MAESCKYHRKIRFDIFCNECFFQSKAKKNDPALDPRQTSIQTQCRLGTAKNKIKKSTQEEATGKEKVVGSACNHMCCESVGILTEEVSSSCLLSLLL